MAKFRKLSVVMPVYNEKNTVARAIDAALCAPLPNLDREIIVVDDGSTDGTREVLANLNQNTKIKMLYHQSNRGKGAALQTAFDSVTGDIVVIQDADLEYDPNDYLVLLKPILEGKADVVFGSRFHSGPRRALFFWHFLGNKFLTFLSNLLNNLNLTDIETGYKMFKSDILKSIKIRSNRFGIEPEFTAKVAKRKLKIYEVPINYNGRDYSEGKKITWRDGINAIFAIIWFRFFD